MITVLRAFIRFIVALFWFHIEYVKVSFRSAREFEREMKEIKRIFKNDLK